MSENKDYGDLFQEFDLSNKILNNFRDVPFEQRKV